MDDRWGTRGEGLEFRTSGYWTSVNSKLTGEGGLGLFQDQGRGSDVLIFQTDRWGMIGFIPNWPVELKIFKLTSGFGANTPVVLVQTLNSPVVLVQTLVQWPVDPKSLPHWPLTTHLSSNMHLWSMVNGMILEYTLTTDSWRIKLRPKITPPPRPPK